MKVLIACEYSGVVRDAFTARGHEAWSCDLLPTDRPGLHHEGDIIKFMQGNLGWDLVIAHPPCTYMTNSGVCWLHKDPTRWDRLAEAANFFNQLHNCKIGKICIENPIMHKYAKNLISSNYSQIIQPWMFGHTEQKATCLWLQGLPLLKPTKNVKEAMMKLPHRDRNKMHYLPPSKDRWKIRSTTYQGIADAMAEQWG